MRKGFHGQMNVGESWVEQRQIAFSVAELLRAFRHVCVQEEKVVSCVSQSPSLLCCSPGLENPGKSARLRVPATMRSGRSSLGWEIARHPGRVGDSGTHRVDSACKASEQGGSRGSPGVALPTVQAHRPPAGPGIPEKPHICTWIGVNPISLHVPEPEHWL